MPIELATPDAIDRAGQLLRAGGLVAMPTETVYGLAADATNGRAVAAIYAAKGRPQFNPLIVHVASVAAARELAHLNGTAERLALAFWPGPLTLVLAARAGNGVADLVTAGLETVAILGHSWGGFVTMHYALRYPERVSHMILLNTASASNEDVERMGEERSRMQAPHRERLDALESSAAFLDGDPGAVAEYYRIDFGTTFKRPEDAARLNLTWTREDILKGRAIEDRLAQGLYWVPGYTIIPALKNLRTPTLVIHGENDFFPVASSAHIAEAIPGARLVTLADSGHFSYIDAPQQVRLAIDAFFEA